MSTSSSTVTSTPSSTAAPTPVSTTTTTATPMSASTPPACPFVWYDLATSDCASAQAFYQHVVGWNAVDAGMAHQTYIVLSAGTIGVGGVMSMPDEMPKGTPACWNGYIGVSDVDVYAQKVVAAGGAIHKGPQDIPGVGRFAVAVDPQGAAFIVFKGNSAEQPAPVAPGAVGHIGWHELQTTDMNAAMAFYGQTFGWTPTDAMDMGPLGTYQMFATGKESAGGMMTKSPTAPNSFWLYYFNVDGIDAASQRVLAQGGALLQEPQPVPGGWTLCAKDPQGGNFALFSENK